MTNKILQELKDAYSFARDPALKLAIDRIEQLEAALRDEIEGMEFWGAYASDYFKDKHGLNQSLIEIRAALGRKKMSKLKFDLDMEHLETKLRPAMAAAVDEALAGIDIKAKVLAALNEQVSDGHSFLGIPSGPSMSFIDNVIKRVMGQEIEEFVRSHVFAHKDFLEDALLKAIRNSEQKLTKAFVKAMLDAVDDQTWEFDLSMRLEAKACD